MQLTRRPRRCAVLTLALCAIWRSTASAQLEVGAGSSLFREAGGPLEMMVIVPEVDAQVTIDDSVAVRAAWTADIVSGASVAVVDSPAASVDAISAASVHDARHVLGGGVSLLQEQSSVSLGYRYGFENDYRSHGLDLSARTELFERNTTLEVAYARSFDSVCDGKGAEDPVLKPRLDSSVGCFDEDANDREERDLDVHGLQVALTQALTPALLIQASLSATLQHGLLSNPYRAVRIGQTAAQEHHPENRARYAATLAARFYLEPLSGALQPSVRLYRDSWDLRALSAELGYEQELGAGLRLRGRGRLHIQTGAAFYSDDYVLMPRGSYFTGDRELSPLKTVLAGAQLGWTVPAGRSGLVADLLSGLEITLKGDVIKSFFDDFHYDRVKPPNDTAILATLSLLARF